MNTDNVAAGMIEAKAKLSSMWIVVMFALLGADVLSLYIPGADEEVAHSPERRRFRC